MQTLGDCMNAIQPLRPASLLSMSPGITISSKLFTMSSTLAEGRPQTNERHPTDDIITFILLQLVLFQIATLLADIANHRLFERRR